MAEAIASRPGSVIGTRTVRFDAADKVTGQARYLGDLVLPGMLHGALLLAQHPHARVTRIDTSEAESMPGVKAVVTYRDVPDRRYGPLVQDQRLFVKEGEKVTYMGDIIAAVAATSIQQAREAARRIRVEYEVLPPLFDPEEALNATDNLIHPEYESYGSVSDDMIRRGNDCGYTTIIKGDIAQGFAEADVVVEERYVADHSHPAPMETHGVLAQVDASGRATIWSATQVPYMARSGVADALEMPLSKVRVIVPTLGGGFGGKCEFGLEAHAVAMARKAGRPVRLVLTRAEEFIIPNMTRHGAVVYIKSGVKKDGTITARQAKVILDTGANAAHGPACAEIATMMAAGPYRIPHIMIEGHAVYTNKTSAGSVRAPTGPQIGWASEQHTDSLAHAVGMDPYDFRMKNLVDEGDTGPTGQVFGPTGARECLKRAAELIGWHDGKRELEEGTGLSCGWWFTFSAPSSVTLKLNDDGTVTLLTGANENGSGSVHGLIHLVAEEMGISPQDVSLVYQDTDVGGWDAGSSGSQTTFSVGRAIQKAAVDLRTQICEIAAEMLEVAAADLEVRDGGVHVRGTPGRSVSLGEVASEATAKRGPLSARGADIGLPMPPEAGLGCAGRVSFPAFIAPGFCTHAVRVRVDEETGIVSVLEAATVQEVGRIVNPLGIEGQMEGGLVHSMGTALTERTHFQDGRTANAGFMDYKLITAADAPAIHVGIVETPAQEGPYGGVRGVGEPPVVATTGAIGNAIRDATGVLVTHLPMTPDRVYAALQAKKGR